MNKIIYSARVMAQLTEMGFKPSYSMPNPYKPQFTCWVYERDDKFDSALSTVLEAEGK